MRYEELLVGLLYMPFSLQGYLSQTESYARDLQAKLSERASSPESSTAKLIVANLKADVQELQSKYEVH